MTLTKQLSGLLIITCTLDLLRGEIFNALVDMRKIVTTQRKLATSLSEYIEKEEARLAKLKYFADRYNVKANTAQEKGMDNYLEHPVHAFLLVKGLVSDWQEVRAVIQNTTSTLFVDRISSSKAPMPEEVDMVGAAEALVRLQETYNIRTADIAKGRMIDGHFSPKFSVSDCQEVARVLDSMEQREYQISWLKEALTVCKKDDCLPSEKVSVIKSLAHSYESAGNIDSAMKYAKDWIKASGESEEAKMFKANLQKKKKQKETSKKVTEKDDKEKMVYRQLCRDDGSRNISSDPRLSCYLRRAHPLFALAPMKEELLHVDPHVVVFHDVISEQEVTHIMKIATPLLVRSKIQAPNEGASTHKVGFRTSKSAWLPDENTDKILRRVNARVAAMTGLDLNFSESLQVLNYGIGGHYIPHFDFVQTDVKKKPSDKTSEMMAKLQAQLDALAKERGQPSFNIKLVNQADLDPVAETFGDGVGNRIATVLFYLTDVKAGGATVFPRLGLKVPPRKGSCLFWYNLRRSGRGDRRTKHAACPVLVGTKWVCNKWLHESGQEFRRPCGLSQDD